MLAKRNSQERQETHFKLPSEKWHAFCKALDRKSKSITALKKLLKEPDVFDRQTKVK